MIEDMHDSEEQPFMISEMERITGIKTMFTPFIAIWKALPQHYKTLC